jgi:hypothetical protein
MIPIKIQCGCGQKYAFEVEPFRGRMPQRVECPACGADGTTAANQAIAEQLAASSEAVSAPVANQLYAGPPLPMSNQRRVAAPLLAVAIVLGAAVGVGIYLQKNSIPGAAQANDDLPRTLAELNEWYAEPPEGQNAAVFFQSGLDALDITPEDHSSPHLPWIGKATVPSLNQRVPVQMKAEIAGLLKRNREAMEFFQRGASLAGSRYPVDFTKAPDLDLSHLYKLTLAVRLVSLSALIAADEDEAESAGALILRGTAIVRSLEPEPTLMSQLIRVRCMDVLMQGVEQVVNRAVLPREILAQLREAFDRAAASEAEGADFTRGMVGERTLALATFSLPPEKLNKLLNRSGEPIPSSALSNLPAQQRAYERIMRKVLAARNDPLPARLTMTEQLVAESIAEVRVKKYYLLDELVSLPVLENAARREASSLAGLRVAQIAIALERWRAANGHSYPDSIEELVPEYLPVIPSSPFNDQPLVYRSRGGGYELACASPGAEKINFTAHSSMRGP